MLSSNLSVDLTLDSECLLTDIVSRMARDRRLGVRCELGEDLSKLSTLLWVHKAGCIETCGLVDFINACEPPPDDCGPVLIKCSEIKITEVKNDCCELTSEMIKILP